MKELTVSSVPGGETLGWARLTDDGQLVTSSPAVQELFLIKGRQLTEEELNKRFITGWSNGYVEIRPK